jgi:hypothetical protein
MWSQCHLPVRGRHIVVSTLSIRWCQPSVLDKNRPWMMPFSFTLLHRYLRGPSYPCCLSFGTLSFLITSRSSPCRRGQPTPSSNRLVSFAMMLVNNPFLLITCIFKKHQARVPCVVRVPALSPTSSRVSCGSLAFLTHPATSREREKKKRLERRIKWHTGTEGDE